MFNYHPSDGLWMDKNIVMVAMEVKHVNRVIQCVARPLSLTEVRASTLQPYCMYGGTGLLEAKWRLSWRDELAFSQSNCGMWGYLACASLHQRYVLLYRGHSMTDRPSEFTTTPQIFTRFCTHLDLSKKKKLDQISDPKVNQVTS